MNNKTPDENLGFKDNCKLDCEGYAECNNYVPQNIYFKKDEWKE